MVAQHGLDLAINLITAHFGELVAKVCSCLLHKGTLSLQEIVRCTELSGSQVKNCLLVLIQHNCVQAFSIPRSVGFGGMMKAVTQYMLLFDNILHRMRFSKFLVIVKDDLGPECETFLRGLLEHGRLTFEQLLVRATSNQSGATRDALRASFDRLVHAHYVERCPRSEPFLSPSPEEETAPTRKRGPKFAVETCSIEQQAIMAAALSDAERFSDTTNSMTDTMLETKNIDTMLETKNTDTMLETKNTDHVIMAGEKRKHEALEMDKDCQAVITETEVLWRANFVKFIGCLKKKACVTNVRSRLSLDAGFVLEAMIESTDEKKVRDKYSAMCSMDNIIERVRGKPQGISMTMEHVRVILEQLGCRLCSEEAGALYSIDLSGTIEICQNDEVEALVLKRYGREAFRIFRLLAKGGHPVETDRISDITFVEKKEAQGILYKLWKDEYIDMEKIVSQAAGQQQLFLWKVKKNALWEHILNDMYHAALNLSQRIAYIVKQEHEFSQVEEKRVRLRKSRMILESSLLKLDDAFLLFHDF